MAPSRCKGTKAMVPQDGVFGCESLVQTLIILSETRPKSVHHKGTFQDNIIVSSGMYSIRTPIIVVR